MFFTVTHILLFSKKISDKPTHNWMRHFLYSTHHSRALTQRKNISATFARHNSIISPTMSICSIHNCYKLNIVPICASTKLVFKTYSPRNEEIMNCSLAHQRDRECLGISPVLSPSIRQTLFGITRGLIERAAICYSHSKGYWGVTVSLFEFQLGNIIKPIEDG